jgi:hypothetical protein
MSFFSAITKPFTSIFHFLESPSGQAVLGVGVSTVEAIDPALATAIELVKSWMHKVFTVEQIAQSAGQAAGTGTQKAAAVIAAIGPELAKSFPGTTAANIQVINTAVVTILNALGEPATP